MARRWKSPISVSSWSTLTCAGRAVDAGFDEARFVITNAYTGGSDALKKSLETAPRHRDEQYNAFCARELDYASPKASCAAFCGAARRPGGLSCPTLPSSARHR